MTKPTPAYIATPELLDEELRRRGVHVVVLSGIPGSGKSHLTYRLKLLRADVLSCSADDFVNYARGDVPSQLSRAHSRCFSNFLKAIMFERPRLTIVDNTNTYAAEASPYMLGAEAFGLQPAIVRVHAPLGVCIGRQKHGVPEDEIAAMWRRWDRGDVMPWWQVIEYVPEA